MALGSFHTGAPTPSSVFPLMRASTVDLIATELRAAIFSGALPIGSALRETEISSQLGVSRSPLREAAQRLVQEGLLTAIPGRGMRVAVINESEVADLYTARLAIAAQAVRMITASAHASQHANRVHTIEQALHALIEASKQEDAWIIGDADLTFHQTLVDAAGSRRLSRAMVTLAIETRIASLSTSEGYSVRRSISPTYQRLMQALHASDAEAALAALEQQFADAIRRLNGDDDSVDTVETSTENEPQEFEPLNTGAISL